MTRYALAALLIIAHVYAMARLSCGGPTEVAVLRDPATLAACGAAFDSDSASYLAQTADLRAAEAPFRYRPLPALLAAGLVAVGGHSPAWAWALLNMLCLVAAGLACVAYLERVGASPGAALAGALLLVSLPGAQATLLFPATDPAALLCAVLLAWAFAEERPGLAALAAVAGVLTKEVFIVGAALALVRVPERRVWGLVALAPAVAFVGVRLALGGSALAVSYSDDPTWPVWEYAARMREMPVDLVVRTGLACGALWLGALGLRGAARRDALIAVPLMVAAGVLLSSHLVRPLGVAAPWLLPGVVTLLSKTRR